MGNIQLKRTNTPLQPVPADGLAGEPFVNLADETVSIAKGDGTNFKIGSSVDAYTKTETDTKLALKENTANKGTAGGYASLDVSGKIPTAQLPSYVDDVVEAADLASLPATGESGKIYITLNDNKSYRWGGSTYVEISTVDITSKEDTANKSTDVGLGDSDILFPTQKAVKTYVDNNSGGTSLPTYTITNNTEDRTLDANNTSINELADVLATHINDTQTGLVGPAGPAGTPLTGTSFPDAATNSFKFFFNTTEDTLYISNAISWIALN